MSGRQSSGRSPAEMTRSHSAPCAPASPSASMSEVQRRARRVTCSCCLSSGVTGLGSGGIPHLDQSIALKSVSRIISSIWRWTRCIEASAAAHLQSARTRQPSAARYWAGGRPAGLAKGLRTRQASGCRGRHSSRPAPTSAGRRAPLPAGRSALLARRRRQRRRWPPPPPVAVHRRLPQQRAEGGEEQPGPGGPAGARGGCRGGRGARCGCERTDRSLPLAAGRGRRRSRAHARSSASSSTAGRHRGYSRTWGADD